MEVNPTNAALDPDRNHEKTCSAVLYEDGCCHCRPGGLHDGAEEERDSIVEWLRNLDPMRALSQDFIADAIERGEHRA